MEMNNRQIIEVCKNDPRRCLPEGSATVLKFVRVEYDGASFIDTAENILRLFEDPETFGDMSDYTLSIVEMSLEDFINLPERGFK